MLRIFCTILGFGIVLIGSLLGAMAAGIAAFGEDAGIWVGLGAWTLIILVFISWDMAREGY